MGLLSNTPGTQMRKLRKQQREQFEKEQAQRVEPRPVVVACSVCGGAVLDQSRHHGWHMSRGDGPAAFWAGTE